MMTAVKSGAVAVTLSLGGLATGTALGAQTWTKAQASQALKTAEEIRSLETAELSVDLKTVEGGKNTAYDLKILRSTERRAYIEFLKPPEELGRRMLARGMQYWSTFPDSHKVVAVSRKEMIGNSAFALADIFQLDAEADYNAAIVAAEKIGSADVLKMVLNAKREEAPYAKIEYWIEQNGYFPVTAKFYGVSGKHLKTMTVESRAEIAGRQRPDVTKMVDEVTKGHVSWWKTKTMTKVTVPDAVFSQDYLKKGGS